jgi:hypothetical protein
MLGGLAVAGGDRWAEELLEEAGLVQLPDFAPPPTAEE